jgi:beta-xylosidase
MHAHGVNMPPDPERPLIEDYFADPFVFRHGQTYHAVGTGGDEARGAVGESPDTKVFPLYSSTDLRHWEPRGRALVRPDPAYGTTFWAPEVAYHRGIFYMYYSVGFDDRQHHLRVATSADPLGPYRDAGVALTSLDACPFAIDPHPFQDVDGRWYLFHARDFLDAGDENGTPVRSGTALVVHELESMLTLAPRGKTVLRPRWEWQRFLADRPMYGRRFDWHTLEGPSVIRHAGRYYCLYSAGRWDSDTYGVDYAVADSVLGPYEDSGGPGGPRLLRTVPGHLIGPGHVSLVLGPDGVTEHVAYHAWDAGMTARRLHMATLEWTDRGPRCMA